VITYVLGRVLLTIPVLIGAAIFIFLLFQLIPGDVVSAAMGVQLLDADQQAAMREALGLDRPLTDRLFDYVAGLMQGDLGRSLRTSQAVLPMILSQLSYTLILIAAGLGVALLIGVPLGLLAALRRNSWVDAVSMSGAVVGVSIPQYWLGLVLILVFAVWLRWLPATGSSTPESLILPAITLGVAEAAIIARLVRSSMVETLGADFVRTAWAKGLADRRVVIRHAFRNSLIPVVTMLGLQIGALLGGAVVVEVVFARPGIGQMIVTAITKRDLPVVQGGVLTIAVIFVLVNLVIDILYGRLDPRIRLGKPAA
jgi:peptide/nickel transport system permease protein